MEFHEDLHGALANNYVILALNLILICSKIATKCMIY